MKTKIFSLVLVVSMLVAILTIGVGISVLEADDHCGSMVLDVTVNGGFADHDDFIPTTGDLGTLRIYLHPVGPNHFTITGNLDDLLGEHISNANGVGNLHGNMTDGYVFTMSLTSTHIGTPPFGYTVLNMTGITEINLDLKYEDGGWWQHSFFAIGVPEVEKGGFFHVYSYGDVPRFRGDYSKCFDFKRK